MIPSAATVLTSRAAFFTDGFSYVLRIVLSNRLNNVRITLSSFATKPTEGPERLRFHQLVGA